MVKNNKLVAKETVAFARQIFGDGFIPLHRPVFEGNERQYLIDCIDSNFVSSVGAKVTEFEEKIADFTGSKHAIATVNGTAALHLAIELAGVKTGDEVISQALLLLPPVMLSVIAMHLLSLLMLIKILWECHQRH